MHLKHIVAAFGIVTGSVSGSVNASDLTKIAGQLGAAENPNLAPIGSCGTVIGGNENSGLQLTPFSGGFDFTLPSPMGSAAGDVPDFHWIHETSGSRAPVDGTMWTFGGKSSREFILHPSIDHGPIIFEGLETTLYGSNDGGSSWVLGTLAELFAPGWNAASVEDQPSSRWVFPKPVSMISAVQGLAQGTFSYIDGDTEIDAVCLLQPPVPAVSEWGMASLGLLLLAGLTIKFRGALPKRA